MAPEEPMRAPTMVSKLLLSRKPSAHRAQPEQLFSTVITTGMSAPPMAAVRVRPYKEKEKRGQKEKKGWRSKVTVMTSEQSTTVTRFHHLNKKGSPPKEKPQARGTSIVHVVPFYKSSLFIYTLGDDANRKCDLDHARATYFTQIWLQWASIKA